jgi:hypothetical protein
VSISFSAIREKGRTPLNRRSGTQGLSFQSIFPVHPTTLGHYRKSLRPWGAKDDPHDAGLLLDILEKRATDARRCHSRAD